MLLSFLQWGCYDTLSTLGNAAGNTFSQKQLGTKLPLTDEMAAQDDMETHFTTKQKDLFS